MKDHCCNTPDRFDSADNPGWAKCSDTPCKKGLGRFLTYDEIIEIKRAQGDEIIDTIDEKKSTGI